MFGLLWDPRDRKRLSWPQWAHRRVLRVSFFRSDRLPTTNKRKHMLRFASLSIYTRLGFLKLETRCIFLPIQHFAHMLRHGAVNLADSTSSYIDVSNTIFFLSSGPVPVFGLHQANIKHDGVLMTTNYRIKYHLHCPTTSVISSTLIDVTQLTC